jgi:hypothetical protein
MVQRFDQRAAAPGTVEQVILKVRVARNHPDVAQHFVEHPRGSAGTALVAQAQQRVPGRRPEESDNDLAVRERRVVVRNLAQSAACGGVLDLGWR